MGGQPEIRVEHGAHHLQGVAGKGKVVRDDKRGEADRRRHRRADRVAVENLQRHAQHDDAPADEDGGGVEVRDRRPAFQHHAGDEPGGMQRETNQQDAERCDAGDGADFQP